MKTWTWVLLPLFVAGCGIMQSMGLSTVDGEPTELARSADALVTAATGISPLMAIGMWKAGEALFTKRGLENTANVVSPASSWKSTLWSLAALLGAAHTPAEAKKG
jgi:hypothetical protein